MPVTAAVTANEARMAKKRALRRAAPRTPGQADTITERPGEMRSDRDGHIDVLVSLTTTTGALLYLRGLPGGGFAVAQSLASRLAPYGVTLGDVNGDGLLDVIVNHGFERLVGVYLQTMGGTLDPERLFETGLVQVIDGRSMAVVDVDGDARADLVVGGDVLSGRPFGQAWPAMARETGAPSRAAGRGSALRLAKRAFVAR